MMDLFDHGERAMVNKQLLVPFLAISCLVRKLVFHCCHPLHFGIFRYPPSFYSTGR